MKKLKFLLILICAISLSNGSFASEKKWKNLINDTTYSGYCKRDIAVGDTLWLGDWTYLTSTNDIALYISDTTALLVRKSDSTVLFITNKQLSDSLDLKLTILRDSTIQVLNDSNLLGLNINIENFGAIGDNATDNSTVIQSAINCAQSLKLPLIIPSGNFKADNLIISDTLTIKGFGQFSKLISYSSDTLIKVQSNNFVCDNVSFEGTGKNTSVLNTAIFISGYRNFTIKDCFFNQFGFSCIEYQQNPDQITTSLIKGCKFRQSNKGVYFFNQGEYVNTTSSNFDSLGTAVHIGAGNNNFTGCNIIGSAVGLELDGGSNNGHGSWIGGSINHCGTGVYGNGVSIGYLISNVNIYVTSFYLKNSRDVQIINSQFGSVSLLFNDAYRCKFSNVLFTTIPVIYNDYLGSSNQVAFENCFAKSGTVWKPYSNTSSSTKFITNDYSCLEWDKYIFADATSNTIDITLPNALENRGKEYIIRPTDVTNQITVNSTWYCNDTIDYVFVSDSATWRFNSDTLLFEKSTNKVTFKDDTIGIGNNDISSDVDTMYRNAKTHVWKVAGIETMRVDESGLDVVGELMLTTNEARLRLQRTTGNNYIDFNSENRLIFRSISLNDTGSNERILIASGGNILINTTTDDGENKLQVEGSTSIVNNLTVGDTSSLDVTNITGNIYFDTQIDSTDEVDKDTILIDFNYNVQFFKIKSDTVVLDVANLKTGKAQSNYVYFYYDTLNVVQLLDSTDFLYMNGTFNADSAVTDFINVVTNPFNNKTILNVTQINEY